VGRDHQRGEGWREGDLAGRWGCHVKPLRPRPVDKLLLSRENDGHEFPAAHPGLDDAPHRRFAGRIEITDGIEAHDALRAERTVKQIAARSRSEAAFGSVSQPKCRSISS